MQTIQQFPSWFGRQKLSGKLAIGCVGLFLLCCICSVTTTFFSPSTSTPEITETAVAEVSPSPIVETAIPTETKLAEVISTETIASTATTMSTATNVPTIAPSNTPRPTATEEATALLPGLMPADVTVNLEQRGFTCGTVDQGQLYYIRSCDLDTADYSLHVEIYGRELLSVDFIDSTVLQYTSPDYEFAASFLGFMATMPYDGAVQQEARNWVETTVLTIKGQGDMAERAFAGVTYRLKGISTAITLEMGDLP